MPFDDLTQFLQSASDAGELERVEVELNPVEEIAAVTQEIGREFLQQSPVIYCERPFRSRIPVVTNLLGNRNRFLRSLGCSQLDEAVQRVISAFNPFANLGNDWKRPLGTPTVADRSRIVPRVIRRAACQQVVKLGQEINLLDLPVPTCWPGETHPAITAGLILTETAEGKPLVEQVPAAVLDRETLLIHWQPSHSGESQWRQAVAAQRPFPVAIALGGDPLLGYVASLPLPPQLNPWHLAGALRQESVNLIRARSVELNVPADAEIILEGYLDPAAPLQSGTIAGEQGVLENHSNLPVLRLTAITHRANPIFPVKIHGFQFQEAVVTSQLTERLLLQLLQLLNPDVSDLHLPPCGGCRQTVFVSTNAASPDQIQQLFQAIGSLPGTAQAGLVVVVPSTVPLRNTDAVWREVSLQFPNTSPEEVLPLAARGERLWIDAA